MKTIIRKATINDLAVITELNQALFDYERKYNDEYNLTYSHSEKAKSYFTRRIEDADALVLVAEQNTTVVGYILVFISTHAIRKPNPIAEIETFFIHENFRDQGLGKRLMQEVKTLLTKRGVTRLRVSAMIDNTDGIRFYKNAGFSEFELILEAPLEQDAS